MIHYELRLEGCVAEVWLNDIPLARVDGTKMAVHTRVAHGYLVPGENVLELVAAPGATPAVSRTGRSAAPLDPAAKALAPNRTATAAKIKFVVFMIAPSP